MGTSLRQWIDCERKENTDSNLLRRLPALTFAIERYDDAIQRFSFALENYISTLEHENRKTKRKETQKKNYKAKQNGKNPDEMGVVDQITSLHLHESLCNLRKLTTRHVLLRNKEKENENSTYRISKKRSRSKMEQSESKGKGIDGTYYSFDNNEGEHEDEDGQEEQNNHSKGYLSKRINIFGHDVEELKEVVPRPFTIDYV